MHLRTVKMRGLLNGFKTENIFEWKETFQRLAHNNWSFKATSKPRSCRDFKWNFRKMHLNIDLTVGIFRTLALLPSI